MQAGSTRICWLWIAPGGGATYSPGTPLCLLITRPPSHYTDKGGRTGGRRSACLAWGR